MKLYTIDEVAECISRIHSDETVSLNLYTVDEITKMLKLNRITIYNYIKTKKLKAFKIGRAYRIQERDLLEFIQKVRQSGESKMRTTSIRWGNITNNYRHNVSQQY